MNPAVVDQRRGLLAKLFPKGVPRLWCPTLTHFWAARETDSERIRAHLRVLAPSVRGILTPGSTGEGWEMSDGDIRALLGILLDAAWTLGIHVLIGILKTKVEDVFACLDGMEEFRRHPAFAGFTVCPPKGEGLGQAEIREALARVLALGFPTALYQLPQVTQNEMSAKTVAALAGEFPNFLLFKDTSGEDRVAQSGLDLGGVFLVRGAEKGGYARWPRSAGGPYDGFLLSTANVFAKELAELLRLRDAGDAAEAGALSEKLATVVGAAFEIVTEFPSGNAFANANKAIDHCMAYGEEAVNVEPPLLYSGVRLPADFIARTTALLAQHGLMPRRGYLSR